MHGIGKRFVYVLRNDRDPNRHYVGIMSDVDNRLEWHNFGPCGYTTRHRPWSLVVVLEFPTEEESVRFEEYPEERLRPGVREEALRHGQQSARSCRDDARQ